VVPNPSVDGQFRFNMAENRDSLTMDVVDISGRIVASYLDLRNGDIVRHGLLPGKYHLKLSDGVDTVVLPMVVK